MSTPNSTKTSLAAAAVAMAAAAAAFTQGSVDLPDQYELVVAIDEAAPDIHDAIVAQVDACEAAQLPGLQHRFRGCPIRIPAGEHRLTETVVLCRGINIHGDGGAGWSLSTRIRVDAGVTAFRIGSASECEDLGYDGEGIWSSISNVAIYGDPCPANDTCAPSFGVNMHSRGRVSEVLIDGFTQGIRVSTGINLPNLCDGTDTDCKTNANLWHVESAVIQNTEHAGMYVGGADANGGLGSLISVVSHCTNAAAHLVQFGECGGIVDRSFLGNTWIAPHTAAGNVAGHSYPGYLMQGASQRPVLIGPYSESDQAAGVLSLGSVSIGGLSHWNPATQGLRISGPDFFGAIRIFNHMDPANVVHLDVGNHSPGAFFAAASVYANQSKPLRLKYRLLGPDAGEYLMDVANLGSARAFGIRSHVDAGDLHLYGEVP